MILYLKNLHISNTCYLLKSWEKIEMASYLYQNTTFTTKNWSRAFDLIEKPMGWHFEDPLLAIGIASAI